MSTAQANAFDLLNAACSLFGDLKKLSFDGIGITRESYGRTEQSAIELIERFANSYGLQTSWDTARNLLVTLHGSNQSAPFLLCGSHLDSVPEGGNYDGAAGVVAGLLCLCKMHALNIEPKRTIKLIVLRGEESAWFGKACLGSSALMGKLTETDLQLAHRSEPIHLVDAMRSSGVQIDLLKAGKPLMDPSSIAAYLELHIEQGPILAAQDTPVAIVNGIRGNIRHKNIRCTGEAGHSGAVPYALRHDAALATADLLMRLETHWKQRLQEGEDLVVTTGMLNTNPQEQAMTRIPGEVSFSLDIRSLSQQTLDEFYALFRQGCDAIAVSRGVRFEMDTMLHAQPVVLSAEWIEQLKRIAERLGLQAPVLASGASHDAAVFAEAGVPTVMIFVRNDHGSHNPAESMDIGDFLLGTQLLYEALLEEA